MGAGFQGLGSSWTVHPGPRQGVHMVRTLAARLSRNSSNLAPLCAADGDSSPVVRTETAGCVQLGSVPGNQVADDCFNLPIIL